MWCVWLWIYEKFFVLKLNYENIVFYGVEKLNLELKNLEFNSSFYFFDWIGLFVNYFWV